MQITLIVNTYNFINMKKLIDLQKQFLNYIQINQKTNFPFKARLLFCLFQNIITKKSPSHICISNFNQFSIFLKSLQKESQQQQIQFLLTCTFKFKKLQNQILKNQCLFPDMQTTCKIKLNSFSITTWDSKKIKFCFTQKNIYIIGKKSQQILNLNEYNIRISRGQQCSIVLQSIDEKICSQKMKKITLKFKNYQIMHEIYKKIKQTVAQILMRKLIDQIRFKNVSDLLYKKYFILLSSQQAKRQSNIIRQFNQNIYCKNQIFIQFSQVQNCKLFRSNKSQMQIKIQGELQENIEFVKENIKFGQNYVEQIIQIFQYNIMIKLKRFQVKGEKYEFICYCQQIGNKNQSFLSYTALQGYFIKNPFKTISIDIKKTNINKTQLSVFCRFYEPVSTSKINFLLSLIKIQQKKQTKNQQNKEENQLKTSCKDIFLSAKQLTDEQINCENFYTAHQIEQEFDSCINDKNETVTINQVSLNKKQSQEYFQNSQNLNNNLEYLRHYYEMNMKVPQQKLFIQTILNQKLKWKINYNKQYQYSDTISLITRQQTYRQFLSKLPSNYFSHKSITNFYFPLQLYQKETLLVYLAKTLGYLPSIFSNVGRKFQSSVQIFKAIITGMISINLLKISSKKFFFPHQGQTFQGFLNGYPLYLQQVERIPCLSRILYQCSNYKVYGCIQHTIHQGLNYEIISNRYPMTIEYKNSKVQFYNCQIKKTGIAYGNMTANLIGKSILLDVKNNMYAQIYFQKDKNGAKISQTNSQFKGTIYKTDSQLIDMLTFQEDENLVNYLRKCDKISNFNGLWHSFINFDDKSYFNFNQNKIYSLQAEFKSLPSDSRKRIDIQLFNNQKYQQCKNQINLILNQTKLDKKLRKKYKLKLKTQQDQQLNSP